MPLHVLVRCYQESQRLLLVPQKMIRHIFKLYHGVGHCLLKRRGTLDTLFESYSTGELDGHVSVIKANTNIEKCTVERTTFGSTLQDTKKPTLPLSYPCPWPNLGAPLPERNWSCEYQIFRSSSPRQPKTKNPLTPGDGAP